MLTIDVNENNKNEIIKKVKKIIKYSDKNNCLIKFNLYVKEKEDFINLEKAINIKDKRERYSFIYDVICNDLDKKISTNYCEFKNDICINYKNKKSNHKNGCCEANGRGKCKYLINSECTMKSCMACKLFTCKYLRKKGIKHNINDYLLSNFFDKKQKYILTYSFWTPKEIVIDRLIKRKYISSFK